MSRILAALMLAVALTVAGDAWAVGAPGGGPQLQIVIVGGDYNIASGVTGDGQIAVSAARDLPVRLVADGQVVPDVVGTATLVTWIDSTPTTGFGPTAQLIVIRVGGGVMLVASRIDTGGGPVSTFSSTPPFAALTGTWDTVGGGAGVTGAGIYDLVVTFTPTLDLFKTISGFIPFVGRGMLPGPPAKPVTGIGTVHATRNVPVFGVANNAVAGQAGTLTSYSINHGPEFDGVTAIDFGSAFLLYACAFPQVPGGIACLVGGSGPVASLSGTVSETAGEFSTITGVTPADLVLGLTGSLSDSGD